ncbi:hypothetical protein K492DRAFT_204768 [Lichtheimia hyalospora FSU 10163]|nr:hypothetical protein K492DRAFT_204768 [Lichtheimia hyalospora FSU 10163]
MAYAQGFKRLRTEEPFIYPKEKKTKVEMELPTSTEINHLPSPTPSVDTPISSSSSVPSATNDTPVLQSFTISTKTNVEYNHINQLLRTVHVNRYGDPELNEAWWQHPTDIDMDYMDMDPTNTYQDINATLRHAFLQRHHHP